MKIIRILFTSLAVLGCVTSFSSAQTEPPTNGLQSSNSWEVTNPDGSPIVPGKTAIMEVTADGDGNLTGKTYLVKAGKKELVNTLTICALCGAPGYYHWTNPASGNTGTIEWDSSSGEYESTGPSGNRRLEPVDGACVGPETVSDRSSVSAPGTSRDEQPR